MYLFVGGSFGVLKLMHKIWQQWRLRRQANLEQQTYIDGDTSNDGDKNMFIDASLDISGSYSFIDLTVSIFLLVWFSLGNYWVYKIYKKVTINIIYIYF